MGHGCAAFGSRPARAHCRGLLAISQPIGPVGSVSICQIRQYLPDQAASSSITIS